MAVWFGITFLIMVFHQSLCVQKIFNNKISMLTYFKHLKLMLFYLLKYLCLVTLSAHDYLPDKDLGCMQWSQCQIQGSPCPHSYDHHIFFSSAVPHCHKSECMQPMVTMATTLHPGHSPRRCILPLGSHTLFINEAEIKQSH